MYHVHSDHRTLKCTALEYLAVSEVMFIPRILRIWWMGGLRRDFLQNSACYFERWHPVRWNWAFLLNRTCMRFQHIPHEGTSLQNSFSGGIVFSIFVVQKYRILFAADEIYRLDSCSPINPYGWVCEWLKFFLISELTWCDQWYRSYKIIYFFQCWGSFSLLTIECISWWTLSCNLMSVWQFMFFELLNISLKLKKAMLNCVYFGLPNLFYLLCFPWLTEVRSDSVTCSYCHENLEHNIYIKKTSCCRKHPYVPWRCQGAGLKLLLNFFQNNSSSSNSRMNLSMECLKEHPLVSL